MVEPLIQPQALDTSQHIVLTMHRIGPPTCCYMCTHRDCERRRREALVPCVVCEARIVPGQRYRIVSRINHEVVTVVHEACERRMVER